MTIRGIAQEYGCKNHEHNTRGVTTEAPSQHGLPWWVGGDQPRPCLGGVRDLVQPVMWSRSYYWFAGD